MSQQLPKMRWSALMDKPDAAEYLSISVSTLDRLVAADAIKPVVLKSMIRFRRADLDDFIEHLPNGNAPGQIRRRQERMAAARAARGA